MQPLLLLHGALGSAATLQPLAEALSGSFEVHLLDLPGHGGSALPESGFSIPEFAEAVMAFLDANAIPQAAVFGYSMGGYVALYLAHRHPERIRCVATLGTKLRWDVPTAEQAVAGLNPDTILQKVPRFAALLQARHAPQDWRAVLEQTAALLRQLGAAPPLTPAVLHSLQQPVLLMRGDRDETTTLDETAAAAASLPNGALGVLPHTPHALEKVDAAVLASLLQPFFQA